MSTTDDTQLLAAGWTIAIIDVRRSIRRQMTALTGNQPLTAAESELLRIVHDAPGCSVRQAAEALNVAQNTVSTQVATLVQRGLLSRRTSATDRRTVELTLTEAALQRPEIKADSRAAIVHAAMQQLSPEDRCALAAALPAFQRLQHLLVQDNLITPSNASAIRAARAARPTRRTVTPPDPPQSD